ncbi:hypothetical protein PR202_gb22445 [Eleusine coracana subsp. coracana]|uniref:Retrotransposon gag domain-containing protein n=1 Tax=Eleusine coracana subsp. coracana TaxID=191504 RepID=A0AAV5FHA3_ELECO|nr:hypothetical protein PR202_gb22445 [Eleusine coracana subsp. coracana]
MMDEIPSTLIMRNALRITDAMRKNVVNGGWMPDGMTNGMTNKRTAKILLQEKTAETTDGIINETIVRILLQETTTTTDVDVMIGIGMITITMTIDDVVMMMMLAHDTAVAQLCPQTSTNPREWLQLYSTAIRSARGDSYVMANYLPVFLDPAVRIWLTSLPEDSITSWGDLNRKPIESFQATCNRPDNHFDLTRIKQKADEPLRDYIKRFCAKKTEIPNVPDQQIITAFLGRIRSDDLVQEIGRRNHDLKLTAQECFKIADKYASSESALDDIRGKGKEKRSDKPEITAPLKEKKSQPAVRPLELLEE